MEHNQENIVKYIAYKAYCLRKWSLLMTSQAGSGHPSSCLSAADIVAAIFFYAMKFDPYNYKNPDNDRFILSKGHAAPLLYGAWHELGLVTSEELLSYRNINSALEGHPTRRFPYVEAATGSLGLGLSIAIGEALSARLDHRSFRTYVLMGDSETSEGSIWEAVQLASFYCLDSIIAFVDCNNLGQSSQTMLDYKIDRYEEIFGAFGWHVLHVDGHNTVALMNVLDIAHGVKGKPIVIIAKTVKGYGVDFIAGKQGFHGKALTGNEAERALHSLEDTFKEIVLGAINLSYEWKPQVPCSSSMRNTDICDPIVMAQPEYKKGEKIATRKAYGQALALLGDVCELVVSLDAEVKNSTYAELFEAIHPERFFQCFVAEQNMISMGVGFDCRNKIPFISTFSCFLTRGHDQIRMAAISNSALRLVGSHCGVSIGQDGPSQMGLEDIAMMRSIIGSVVLYPCDAVSTYKLVEQMAHYNKGITYLRTTRMEIPILYENNESFPIGGCKVLKKSVSDKVCVVAAGVTLFEALKAYEVLIQQNIFISIIDLYSIKPIDSSTLISMGYASGGKIITVEDHYKEGGLGEAVMSAVCIEDITVYHLAVTQMPRSGKPEELLSLMNIDSVAIVQAVKLLQ